MKHILLDQNVTTKLARKLGPPRIETAFRRGWSSLANGDLITAAETAGFDIMITADHNLEYQQNLAFRHIAIIVLDTNRWPLLEARIDLICAAVASATSSSFQKVRCS